MEEMGKGGHITHNVIYYLRGGLYGIKYILIYTMQLTGHTCIT